MKSTGILVKTSALILGFTLVLGVGILSLSFSHGGARRNEDTFLTPEHAVAPPTAQELLQKKFEVYNTVTEEDGKSVVTIFSEEQIADIRTRRENGEWFWLSSEEMLYLINDTVKLFETYDVVRVRDLEGVERVYDRSNCQNSVFEVIQERARALNSATYVTLYAPEYNIIKYGMLTDCRQPLTARELQTLDQTQNPWYNTPAAEIPNMAMWTFGEDIIHFWDKNCWSRYDLLGGYYFWEERTQIFPAE